MENPTTNQSNVSPELKTRVASLYAFMSRRLGIKRAPKIILIQSASNAKKPFGLTAYYNQQNRSIRLYVTERHPTDILRSFSHELIHHWQNEHGALPPENTGGHAHYAQKDPVLRKREMEAYLMGNILFRDWQDENRYGPINENLQITNSHALKMAIKNMLFQMIRDHVITSYHRDATSGDMKPEDFIEDMSKKLELSLEDLLETINNRGNWENQGNMIHEMISRRELKAFIKERINEMGKKWDVKSGKNKKTSLKVNPEKGALGSSTSGNRKQNYAQWLKQFLAHSHSQKKEALKYYEIGFGPGDHYVWYWNPTTQSIATAHGGSHGNNFGHDIPYKTFRGRYDVQTKELSLTIPEFGKMKITKDINKDVPPELLASLNKTFNNPKIFYFPYVV